MKNEKTEIIFILDRSGSMANLAEDTIGGYNSFLKEQRKEVGEALITTVLFDHEYEVLHDRKNLDFVVDITSKEYYARGTTALMDAMGKTITKMKNNIETSNEKYRPSKVIVVIITDGHENDSKEYTQPQIKSMVKEMTEQHDWQFLFLGANIDSASTAEGYGFSAQSACDYIPTSVGTQSLYSTLSKTISGFRETGVVADGWDNDLK